MNGIQLHPAGYTFWVTKRKYFACKDLINMLMCNVGTLVEMLPF